MADYSRYKTKTLETMLDKAETKDIELTSKPIGNWGDGMRLSKLPSVTAWERNRERIEEIKKVLCERK